MNNGFRCEHITKDVVSYRIADIGFSLEPGTVLGVVGLNGVGKTTLLRVLAGSYRVTDREADGGDCWLDGFHFAKDVREYRNRIAFVMQDSPFRLDMTAEQIGEVFGAYYERYDSKGYLARLAEYGCRSGGSLRRCRRGSSFGCSWHLPRAMRRRCT